MRRVLDVRQIKVGEHGLLMKDDTHEGLLLRKSRWNKKWNLQEFLEETCAKAKMRASCWKDEGTDIFQFTAVVFGDTSPRRLRPSRPCLQCHPRGQQRRPRFTAALSHAVFEKPKTGMR